jgi:hypothetical protein
VRLTAATTVFADGGPTFESNLDEFEASVDECRDLGDAASSP